MHTAERNSIADSSWLEPAGPDPGREEKSAVTTTGVIAAGDNTTR